MPALSLLPSFPENDRIIVCEGKSDVLFLEAVLRPFTQRIFIVSAEGNENLANVRALLGQYGGAIYVRDRDFEVSPSEAHQTFFQKRPRTIWTRFDLEGYLLYPDWIKTALEAMAVSPKGKRLGYYVPASATEVEAEIKRAARELVVDYAGRHTLVTLRNSVKFAASALLMPAPKRHDAQQFQLLDWEHYLRQQVDNLNYAGAKIPLVPELSNRAIATNLDAFHQIYITYAEQIDAIQIHFSGKSILKKLVENWGAKFSGDTLRDELVKVAADSVKPSQYTGQLRNHIRLGDIGYLAEKSLADGTQI